MLLTRPVLKAKFGETNKETLAIDIRRLMTMKMKPSEGIETFIGRMKSLGNSVNSTTPATGEGVIVSEEMLLGICVNGLADYLRQEVYRWSAADVSFENLISVNLRNTIRSCSSSNISYLTIKSLCCAGVRLRIFPIFLSSVWFSGDGINYWICDYYFFLGVLEF